jgi:hypothetical protein
MQKKIFTLVLNKISNIFTENRGKSQEIVIMRLTPASGMLI